MAKKTFFSAACLILSCLFWASNYILAKLMMTRTTASPSSITFWRFAIGGALMLAAGLLTAGPKKMFLIPRRDMLAMIGQGIVGMGLVSMLLFWCERFTSAINSTMLDALIPVMILLGGVVTGMKLRRSQFLGMGISLAGCLFVIRAITWEGIQLTAFNFGDVLVVAAAAAWALYVLWGRSLLQRVDSLVYTAWTMLSGMASVGIYALFAGIPLYYPRETEAYWLLAATIFLPSIGAFWCWNQASKMMSLPIQNISQYLIPVSAIVMAHFLLGEPVGGLQIPGIFMILSGIFMDPSVSSCLNRDRLKRLFWMRQR